MGPVQELRIIGFFVGISGGYLSDPTNVLTQVLGVLLLLIGTSTVFTRNPITMRVGGLIFGLGVGIMLGILLSALDSSKS